MIRFLLLLVFLTGPAIADDTPLRKLVRSDEARDWVAVGRVNIGDTGFCTGTLIESNIVLTAAHCFFDKATGKQVSDSDIRFVAGWSTGAANSIRGARKVVINKGYVYGSKVTNERISNDLAIFELDQPIREDIVKPFGRRSRLSQGSSVAIVSYGRGRSEIPSIQESCSVLAVNGPIMTLNCDITFGASGSPVFDMSGPAPRITSVISSMRIGGNRVLAYSVAIDADLEAMLRLVNIGTADRKSSGIGAGSLSNQLGRTGTRAGLPQISN